MSLKGDAYRPSYSFSLLIQPSIASFSLPTAMVVLSYYSVREKKLHVHTRKEAKSFIFLSPLSLNSMLISVSLVHRTVWSDYCTKAGCDYDSIATNVITWLILDGTRTAPDTQYKQPPPIFTTSHVPPPPTAPHHPPLSTCLCQRAPNKSTTKASLTWPWAQQH